MQSRSPYIGNISDYKTEANQLKVHKSEHNVFVAYDKSNSACFCKTDLDTPLAAHAEAASLGVQRAMYPSTPETSLAVGPKDSLYVVSKAINKFRTLYDVIRAEGLDAVVDKIKDGTYRGLGQLMVMAILTGEVDLHTNNIGLNDKNEFVRIDGDWSFARTRHKEKATFQFRITEGLIQKLPFLDTKNFNAFNWFDQLQRRDLNIAPPFLNAVKDILRQEINEGLLKCLLMPTEYLRAVIAHQQVSTESTNTLFMELMQSRQQMILAACENKEFQAYLQTADALKLKAEFQKELSAFRQVNSEIPLDTPDNIVKNIETRFGLITDLAKADLSKAERTKLAAAMPEYSPTVMTNFRGESQFMLALKTRNPEQAKMVLGNFSPQEVRRAINEPDSHGNSPMMVAVVKGQNDIFNLLRFKKADLAHQNHKGNTLLHVAAKADNIDVFSKINKSFDIDAVNRTGNTALIMAAKKGHADMVMALIDDGANPSHINKRDESALLLAIQTDKPELIKILLPYPYPAEQMQLAYRAALQLKDPAIAEAIVNKCEREGIKLQIVDLRVKKLGSTAQLNEELNSSGEASLSNMRAVPLPRRSQSLADSQSPGRPESMASAKSETPKTAFFDSPKKKPAIKAKQAARQQSVSELEDSSTPRKNR